MKFLCSLLIPLFLFELSNVFASVNLARGQDTNQSSVFENLTSDIAVDGQYNLQSSPFNPSCATAISNTSVFWQVKLRELSTVTHIHLVFENTPNTSQILQNYRVYVSKTDKIPSGTLCYQETSRKPELIKHVFCNLNGNYVTYYNDHKVLLDVELSALLICEVEVYGCAVGFYGDSCQFECSKNCKSQLCEPDFGFCTFGCIPGYSGIHCHQVEIYEKLVKARTLIIIISLLALLLLVVGLVAVFFSNKSRKMEKAITGEMISSPLPNSQVYSGQNKSPNREAPPNKENTANGDSINQTSNEVNTRVSTNHDGHQLQSENLTRSYENEQFFIDNRHDYEDLNRDGSHPRGSQHLYDKLKK